MPGRRTRTTSRWPWLTVPRAVCLVPVLLVLQAATAGCLQPVRTADGGAETGSLGYATALGDNGDGSYSAPEVAPGGTVVVAHRAPFSAYNNAVAGRYSPDNALVLNQVLVDPFVVDGNGSVLLNSDVLVSAELSSRDPQVVTYRIKPGVTWSDGAPWDCDDFYLAWLASQLTAPDNDPVRAESAVPAVRAESAECRDSLTFVETYAQPAVEWRHTYLRNAILPAHVLQRETGISDITAIGPDAPPAQLRRVVEFWQDSWVGFAADLMPASGPYRIESAPPGGPTVLVRNERWAGNPGGPERIVFVVADDAAAAGQLASGTVGVMAPAAQPVLADQLRGLAAGGSGTGEPGAGESGAGGPGVVFAARGGASTKVLDLNLARPLFRQPEVRRALAQCLDRNILVDELVRGVVPTAQPQDSLIFLPGAPGYEDRYSRRMPADARQAQHTLERAGWILGQDGVYARDGQRLSFGISHDGSSEDSRIVELIRTQCRQSGLEILDGVVGARLAEVLTEGRFDVSLTTVALTPTIASVAGRYRDGAPRNYQGYANPEVDELIASAEREHSEAAQARTLRQADRLIAEDLVSFPLFQVPVMWAHRDTIERVFQHDTDQITWNANEWTLR